MDLSSSRLAIIGMGKMGETIAQGILSNKLLAPDCIVGSRRSADHRERLSALFPFPIVADNAHACANAKVVLVAVKPQQMGSVLDELAAVLTPGVLLISIAASVPTSWFEKRFGFPLRIVRVMPNSPMLANAGMSALCKGKHASDADLATARALFAPLGATAVVEERHMDAVTGLSGSGPAFVYVVIESLIEGGVKVGMPRDVATLLAAQTVFGAAKMVLETGLHPALLKDVVTTPAGCTVDGLLELEEGKVRVSMIKAVVTATKRASELKNEHYGSE